MNPEGPPPFMHESSDNLKEPRPKSFRELPDYLKRLIGKFLFRLFYIFKIVWDTSPWILFAMVFMGSF